MKHKRKLSLGWPILLEMLFPQFLFGKIKEQLKIDGSKTIHQEHDYMREGAREPYLASQYRTEVLLHLSGEPASQFGHMDFAFGNWVYSYGCYDSSTNRLFGMMSDGVFAISEREAYIKYCLKRENKILIGYPLLLTPEQEQLIRQKLVDFEEELIPWRTNLFRSRRGERGLTLDDPASLLQAAVDAHFYKIKRRKFKTYSVIGSNCALMVDEFLDVLGLDRITPSGIITPGSCYRFFERQLKWGNPIICGRRVYLADQEPQTT